MEKNKEIAIPARESGDYFGLSNRYVEELQPSDFRSEKPWELKPDGDNQEKSGMVLFYAPWCPYCKAMKNDWIEAAKLSGFCDYYAFNCEKHQSHILKIKEDMPELIRSYPSIIIYKQGKPDEYYDGNRTPQGLIDGCKTLCKDCKKRKFSK